MKKPQPKKEIIITKEAQPLGGLQGLRILAFSSDAAEFVEKEAPQFGNLYPSKSPTDIKVYNLYVYTEAYDIDKVKAYLES